MHETAIVCAHCAAPIAACDCGTKVLHSTAFIGCVPVTREDNFIRQIELALCEANIIGRHEMLLFYEETRDWQRSGESCWAVFKTKSLLEGQLRVRQVCVKALIKGFGEIGSALHLTEHARRYQRLASWGIPTPDIYSASRGAIYRQYFDFDWATIRTKIRCGEFQLTDYPGAFEKLSRIAGLLDGHGVRSTGPFLDDLWGDATGQLYYVDVGEDLGSLDNLQPNPDHRPAWQVLESQVFRGRIFSETASIYTASYEEALRQVEKENSNDRQETA